MLAFTHFGSFICYACQVFEEMVTLRILEYEIARKRYIMYMIHSACKAIVHFADG